MVCSLLKSKDIEDREEIIKDVSGFKYPIKAVFEKKMNLIVVITVYPLKRAYR